MAKALDFIDPDKLSMVPVSTEPYVLNPASIQIPILYGTVCVVQRVWCLA